MVWVLESPASSQPLLETASPLQLKAINYLWRLHLITNFVIYQGMVSLQCMELAFRLSRVSHGKLESRFYVRCECTWGKVVESKREHIEALRLQSDVER